jgi:thioredoxin-dependent peroxiredoxin
MSDNPASPPEKKGLGRGEWLFVILLVSIGLAYAGWTGYRTLFAADGKKNNLSERNVAEEARKWLRSQKDAPLSAPLQQLLEEAKKNLAKTMPHALLGKTAPDFTLTDHHGHTWHLNELVGHGPVVLVFYYGYHCDHCVSQLFGVNEDLAKFEELGAKVIAISADPPTLTAERFRQYGEFRFPVLSDPGNKIAEIYGVYKPARNGQEDDLLHGTFVITPAGTVTWTNYGDVPFIDNRTLLGEIANLKNEKRNMPK